MSQSHEKPLDRLLRYSPWAAAAFVAVCLIALVARVAMYAGAADRPEAPAELTAVESGGLESRRLSDGHPTPSNPSYDGLPTPSSPSYDGLPSPSMDSQRSSTASIERELKEPPTPSSKSRLQIHSARDESPPYAAAASANRSKAKPSAATPVLHSLSQPSRRATSLDGRTHTSFFGLEAYGRRFAYVLDRSGSMGDPDNKPLEAAKQELLTSLARLGDIHQFFIIFYNEEPAVFNPGGAGRQAVFADEVTKNSARRFVERVQAHGGTRHYEALAKAIALRPDVIFVLTDGEPKDDLSDEELARLRRSNGGLAQIHVVQFANSPYEGNSLVQLANENRGQHTYKSLRQIMSQHDD